MPLWAVHISDGVLTAPFWLGGFLLAALLLFWGSRRVQDEEIPRIALLTAAFFVASTIHLKAPPTSVHLLLNGLTGVLLGRRAALAIAGGLVLQAILIGHGGFYSLGANICVMTCPALLAGLAFPFLRRQLRAHRGVICSALVFVSCSLLFVTTVFSLAMVGYLIQIRGDWREHLEAAWNFTAQPWLLVAAFAFALPAAWLERRVQATPLFALGFFLGSLTVLATSGLNCLVLLVGGEKVWPVAPWALVVLHLPVAVLEGLIMGVTLKFLSRVKPELLDTPAYAQPSLTPTMPESNPEGASHVDPP